MGFAEVWARVDSSFGGFWLSSRGLPALTGENRNTLARVKKVWQTVSTL